MSNVQGEWWVAYHGAGRYLSNERIREVLIVLFLMDEEPVKIKLIMVIVIVMIEAKKNIQMLE